MVNIICLLMIAWSVFVLSGMWCSALFSHCPYPITFHFFRKELVEADDVERIVIIGVGCKLEGQQKRVTWANENLRIVWGQGYKQNQRITDNSKPEWLHRAVLCKCKDMENGTKLSLICVWLPVAFVMLCTVANCLTCLSKLWVVSCITSATGLWVVQNWDESRSWQAGEMGQEKDLKVQH